MANPKVGVGVIIIRDNKLLLGKRKGAHGPGSWSLPGGHLEFNEEIEDCAKREVEEETGLKVKNIQIITCTNDIFKKEGKHDITIFVKAEYIDGEPKVMEPERCLEWAWFDLYNLPQPLFLPLQNFLKTINLLELFK